MTAAHRSNRKDLEQLTREQTSPCALCGNAIGCDLPHTDPGAVAYNRIKSIKAYPQTRRYPANG